MAAGPVFRAVPVVYTALETVNMVKTHVNPNSSADEKYYSKVALAGSALATAASFVPAVAGAAAIGFTTVAAAPVLLTAAGLVGAGAWAYGTYKQNQARQAREALPPGK